MNKKLTRTLAGAMSLMFMGQVMIFGDGSAQGLLHADTIASAAEAIEGAKNKDQLAKEFEEATKDLGKVDFFDVADEKENGTVVNEDTAKNDIAVQSDEAGAAVQDRSAAVMAASEGDAPAGELTVTGIVKQGVILSSVIKCNQSIYRVLGSESLPKPDLHGTADQNRNAHSIPKISTHILWAVFFWFLPLNLPL